METSNCAEKADGKETRTSLRFNQKRTRSRLAALEQGATMQNRTQGLAQSLLIAALVSGASYLLPILWIHQQGLVGMDEGANAVRIVWKGAGVGLLALYAATQARSLDGWLIALVMAFGALGDVLLDAVGLEVGALAFALGHGLAIWLYLRNRRNALSGSQRLLAVLMPPCVLFATWMMTADVGATFYALILSFMASLAWTSRFPRFRTGVGAIMFVVSDLLIFARESGTLEGGWVSFAIWGLYFGGQVLIALGVIQTLREKASG